MGVDFLLSIPGRGAQGQPGITLCQSFLSGHCINNLALLDRKLRLCSEDLLVQGRIRVVEEGLQAHSGKVDRVVVGLEAEGASQMTGGRLNQLGRPWAGGSQRRRRDMLAQQFSKDVLMLS